ncbi:MAG: RelA/SpoT family protein [Rikenellaceae bacterium]|nr:RelA/SpoT family protein [Rikenellaceae bacterium]
MEYTEQDEILIGKLQEELFKACERIAKKESDMELVRKAFYFAKDAHKGVRRKSGEPYIVHPISVALIVVNEIELGIKSVVAALMHDIVEDTEYTVSDIEHLFGPKIASMVDGLTKMAGVFSADQTEESETSKQAENFKKMLLTLSDDVRVIIIKIADRLHNMRTLGSMPAHKQMKITSETIYLFAPLTHRLGLFAIKSELEDLSLKYRFPEDYKMIESKISATEANRNKYIEKFNSPIADILRANDIDFEISGRVKSIYSIWRKMQRKNIDFEEIYDIFAIRIVFKPSPMIPEKSQCWHIYSLVTDIYKPKPDRIKDWVNIPKANGYEALHCTVMGPDGEWVEVQIRSQRMEEIAEKGFAAHWKYKEQSSNSDGEIDKWLKRVREALSSSVENAVEFLDNFKLSLYSSEIVVFTPKGDQVTLPQGATALDLAYDIHSKIGHTAVGAKINHKIDSIFTPISSGDQVEIITSNNVKPKPEWLDHVVTSKAKNSIKNFIKKDNQNNIERGIVIFEEKMKSFGIQPSARVFRKVLPAYQCSSKGEFYSKLGAGIINLNGVEKILRQNAASKMIKYWSLQLSNPLRLLKGSGNSDQKKKSGDDEIITSEDEYNMELSIADCCSPIPGDQVIGFRGEDGRVTIHKKSCKEAVKLAAQHGENIVKAQWSGFKAISFLTHVEVRGIDRMGIMLDMAKLISEEMNVNIRELKLQSHDGIFEGVVSLYVKSIEDLKVIMSRLNKIRGVEKVRRIETYRE